jgi:hypothetical protein
VLLVTQHFSVQISGWTIELGRMQGVHTRIFERARRNDVWRSIVMKEGDKAVSVAGWGLRGVGKSFVVMNFIICRSVVNERRAGGNYLAASCWAISSSERRSVSGWPTGTLSQLSLPYSWTSAHTTKNIHSDESKSHTTSQPT